MNEKSKLNQIQSKIEVLIMHFSEKDDLLKNELYEILQLIKDEQELRGEILNQLSNIVGRL